MKPLLRTTLWIGFWATLLVALALSLFLAWVFTEGLPPGTVITIDNERFVMPQLVSTGQWALVAMGVLIASMVMVVVAPLVIVLGIGVPLAAGALSIALAVLTMALLVLPFILLLRWLWKGKGKPTTIAG